MKGELGIPFACPLGCGTLMPARSTPSPNITIRRNVRRRLEGHFVAHHPALRARERTELLDRLCERLGI